MSAVKNGLAVAFVGYIIVFVALVILYFFYSNFPKLLNLKFKKSRKVKKDGNTAETQEAISSHHTAAISSALYLYFSEMHDDENTIITIKRVSKTYSPWSSKIYGMRQSPRQYK